jgi:hypothetical protein
MGEQLRGVLDLIEDDGRGELIEEAARVGPAQGRLKVPGEVARLRIGKRDFRKLSLETGPRPGTSGIVGGSGTAPRRGRRLNPAIRGSRRR